MIQLKKLEVNCSHISFAFSLLKVPILRILNKPSGLLASRFRRIFSTFSSRIFLSKLFALATFENAPN